MNAILAIDGGGTRTRAGLYDEQGALLAEAEGDATNLSKWPVSHVVHTIAMLAGEVTKDSNHTIRTVLAGISGAGRTGQAQAVATGLAQALATSDVRVCSDAHMLSFANLDAEHPILVIAGTGSAVITRRADGSRIVTGGWGPILGDEGGAYRLALEGIRRADEDEALRKALVAASGEKNLPALHLRLGVQAPAETAELSTVVTREAEAGNIAARAALRDQAEKLAALARHGLTRAGIDVDALASLHVLVTGGLMDCELYLDEFASALLPEESIVIVERPKLAGHRAALELARAPDDAAFVKRPEPCDIPAKASATKPNPITERMHAVREEIKRSKSQKSDAVKPDTRIPTALAVASKGDGTSAGLYDEHLQLLAELSGPFLHAQDQPWRSVLHEITTMGKKLAAKAGREVTEVCVGVPGAGEWGFGKPMADELSDAFHTPSVFVANDLYTLCNANFSASRQLLVISDDRAIVAARPEGCLLQQLGGIGPILRNEGSAYAIAIEAIGHAVQPRVRDEKVGLGFAMMDALELPSNMWLYPWLQRARKDEIAALAKVVFEEAKKKDLVARDILRRQAGLLAELLFDIFPKAQLHYRPDDELVVLVSGWVFDSDYFKDSFLHALRGRYRNARVESPPLMGHQAAIRLREADPSDTGVCRPGRKYFDAHLRGTEGASNERPLLDELKEERISRRMTDLELASIDFLRLATSPIGAAISAAAACIRAGGRIIYAGAGTSGRLGVLDASECPPTFGVDEGRVIGLIAGGEAALRHSIEGAEDDTAAGARDIDAITPKVGKNDIVIGITASGTTPYALAAIDRGKALGAKTALVCCNAAPLDRADIVIALETGPEVLPGSTRLKAGTATKMVLNQISTGAMAKAGYVFEGRMVGVRPLNKKLRLRCIRIIAELTNEDAARAELRLDETGGSIRLAVLMARKGLPLDEARRRLDACQGVLRDALEMA